METPRLKPEIYTLNNGLVVALQRTPTRTVSAKLRVNYGSSDEVEGEEGLAHFLEHCLVTGGSKKYDPIIADEIRRSIGQSNAFTSIGRTCFTGNMLHNDLLIWLDYTADHVLRPKFDKIRVDGERERVLREISDAKSHPVYLSQRKFAEVFYRDHPRSRFNLGKSEVVENADENKLKNFHQKGYYPNNMDLILVGNLPEGIDSLVKEHFEAVPEGPNTRKEFPILPRLNIKTILHDGSPELINKDNPKESSAQISLCFSCPYDTHPDEYAFRITGRIFADSTSNSRLYQTLGLGRGLAYSSGISINGSYRAGVCAIGLTIPATRINEAVDAVFEEMQKVRSQGFNEKEIRDAKKGAEYEVAKSYESNEGNLWGIELRLNDGIAPDNIIDEYEKVTNHRILDVANQYLPDKDSGNYVLHIRDPLKKD